MCSPLHFIDKIMLVVKIILTVEWLYCRVIFRQIRAWGITTSTVLKINGVLI